MSDERFLKPLREAQSIASVRQVFGEPTTVGEKTIIPVASVTYAFGYGYGGGPERTDDQGRPVRSGGGGGGGGQAKARPVAVLEVTPSATTVRAVEDTTRIAIAGIAFAAWATWQVGATIRRLARGKK